MANGFKANRGGIRKLLVSPQVGDALLDKARPVAGRAKGSAPVETGGYQDSIEVRLERSSDRLVARVIATVDYANVVESRTRNLGKALGNG